MIDIYFEDLGPKAQAEILRAEGIDSARELVRDGLPLFTYVPDKTYPDPMGEYYDEMLMEDD